MSARSVRSGREEGTIYDHNLSHVQRGTEIPKVAKVIYSRRTAAKKEQLLFGMLRLRLKDDGE